MQTIRVKIIPPKSLMDLKAQERATEHFIGLMAEAFIEHALQESADKVDHHRPSIT